MTMIYRGGNFLNFPLRAEGYRPYIPEAASDVVRELTDTIRRFAEKKVRPILGELEDGLANGFAPMIRVFKEVGQLGLLGAELPTAYGGEDLSLCEAAHILDVFGQYTTASVNVTIFGHTGIGSLPLVLYGTEEQKRRFLPKFATGEWMAAFALTEPEAGSATNNIRSTAVLSDDGQHYELNGSKCFISNGGIADVITVFAMVNGRTTAFLVTKDMPGFSAVEEQRKLGLHGSSTAQLFFENVKIPVANRIGAEGQGDDILKRTLYRGRYNIAAIGMGEARRVFDEALAYALQRVQRRTIIKFGAVQNLLATAALGVFGIESMAYRGAGDFDLLLAASGNPDPDQMAAVHGALSVEDCVAKVYGSEQLGIVVRHALKVFGGYGFLEDIGMARPLRDQVVSEIYDGTNQVHEVYTIGGQLRRMAQRGEIETQWSHAARSENGPLAKAVRHTELLKETALHALGEHLIQPEASDLLDKDLSLGQLALTAFSRLVIQAHAADSAVRRAMRLEAEFAGRTQGVHVLLAETLATEALQAGLGHFEEMLAVLHPEAMRFPVVDRIRRRRMPVGTMANRAAIAKKFAALGSYRLV